MSRRVTLAVLLAGMTVSAIIIIITISNSINNWSQYKCYDRL